MMFPLFSILRREPDFSKPPATFVLLHLKRVHLMEWVRAVVGTTLSLEPHTPLPPLLLQSETDSVWKQIREQPRLPLQPWSPGHVLSAACLHACCGVMGKSARLWGWGLYLAGSKHFLACLTYCLVLLALGVPARGWGICSTRWNQLTALDLLLAVG